MLLTNISSTQIANHKLLIVLPFNLNLSFKIVTNSPLCEYILRIAWILFNLFNQFGENRLRLLGEMLKDLLTITPDGVAYMVLDKETLEKYHVDEGDTEGFVNMPLSIKDVRMSLVLKEDGNRVRVSIRSKKGTSANRCARGHFNGGGHENAAGGRLYIPQDITSISEAGKYIEEHTHTFFKEEHEA